MPDFSLQHNSEHSRFCNCLTCRRAWEAWHEAKYAWRRAQEAELRQAKPATDEEWAAFMDREFPRAKEGMSRG